MRSYNYSKGCITIEQPESLENGKSGLFQWLHFILHLIEAYHSKNTIQQFDHKMQQIQVKRLNKRNRTKRANPIKR